MADDRSLHESKRFDPILILYCDTSILIRKKKKNDTTHREQKAFLNNDKNTIIIYGKSWRSPPSCIHQKRQRNDPKRQTKGKTKKRSQAERSRGPASGVVRLGPATTISLVVRPHKLFLTSSFSEKFPRRSRFWVKGQGFNFNRTPVFADDLTPIPSIFFPKNWTAVLKGLKPTIVLPGYLFCRTWSTVYVQALSRPALKPERGT